MRRGILIFAILTAASFAAAQVRVGDSIVPNSSIEMPGDAGVRMHTNYFIYAPEGAVINPKAQPLTTTIETPGSLGCIYDVVSKAVSGCPVATALEVPTGGSDVIVIVDAYDDSSASADLGTFSTEFGLPKANFSVQYASGKKPANACSSGWEGEEALDVQWAHAMAPNAQIVLMEAKSNSNTDLYAAVVAANSYIAKHGGKGEVSMSWGASEFSGETADDANFTQSDVVYLASSGDASGVLYPSASPNVVSAGGTQINRNSSGNYTSQVGTTTCGTGCGGGTSKYENIPSYQSSVSSVVGTKRGTPDIASDASSNSPVYVYTGVYDTATKSCVKDWYAFYGTSVASPTLAGVINHAGTFNASSNAELTEIYADYKITADYTDVTSGSCATHSGKKGYDLCTGVGVVKGLKDK